MWGNDRWGDCTLAACANFWAIASKLENATFGADTDKIVAAYLALTKGKDVGLVEHDVLNAAMRGLHLGGDLWRLAAWVEVDITDRETCRRLVADLGALYLGVDMPLTAQRQVGALWQPPDDLTALEGDDAPGSWGGHALLWADYEENGDLGLVTWGAVQKATPAWLTAYCDEAYALLDEARAAAMGVDWDALVADLEEVKACAWQ